MATTPKTSTVTVEATELDPRKIAEHPMNPRENHDPDEGLVASVREHGVLERLVLAPVPADLPDTARKALKRGADFVLIAGHRRRGAAIAAKLKTVPVDIRHDLDTTEKQLAVIAAENIHRSDLSALEEGDLYLALGDLGLNQAQISERTSVAKPRVSERTRVAKLPEPARKQLASHQITLDAALTLAKVADDPDEVARIAAQPAYVWDQEVRRVLAAKEAAREVARREKELAKAGVRVLDEYPPEPTPDDDGDDAPAAWWRLDDLLRDVAYDGVIRATAAHHGIELDPDEEDPEYVYNAVDLEDVEAWHQATCEGHAVVRRRIKDWQGERTIWPAICTTPAAHDDLLDAGADSDGGPLAGTPGPARATTGEPVEESPEVAARRKHLEQRVDAHTKWLAKLIEENPPQLHERALAKARAKLPRIELDDAGRVDQYREDSLERRRAFLDMPDDATPADVEEAFHALADRLDIGQLHLLYRLVEHGPAYGDYWMREPCGFNTGWAYQRVRLLNELGWLWDDQELDEIRQHPKLAASLGIDAAEDEDGTVAEGEVA